MADLDSLARQTAAYLRRLDQNERAARIHRILGCAMALEAEAAHFDEAEVLRQAAATLRRVVELAEG